MAGVIKKIAEKLDLATHDDLIYGRVNDIYFNVGFIRHERAASNSNLIEALMQPKYDSVRLDVYAGKKYETGLSQVNGFIEDYYPLFKASPAKHSDGRFLIILVTHETLNIKASYVVDFLLTLSDFLRQNEFFSACTKCGGNESISHAYNAGKMKEVCESCLLKEIKI